MRASASWATARMGDPGSVSRMLKLLDDPDQNVRMAALLALGQTGSKRAVHKLLQTVEATDSTGGRYPQTFALLGLALASQVHKEGAAAKASGSSIATSLVQKALAATRPGEANMVGVAALSFARLETSPALLETIRDWASAQDQAPAARSCAMAALAVEASGANLKALLEGLGSRRLAARRAAALALRGADRDSVSGPLRTAYELESELLTRGFLLLSIGDVGGTVTANRAESRFLLRELLSGSKPLRAWAALGLGRLLGSADKTTVDAKTRTEIGLALRHGFKREKNHDNRGAYLIAMGLAGDDDALSVLVSTLRDDKNSFVRSLAADGLALLGDPRGLPALREGLVEDSCAFVRAAVAEALGRLGERSDAKRLAAAFDVADDQLLRSRIVAGLGELASKEALHEVLRLAAAKTTDDTVRAAAYRSLGNLLAQNATPPMAQLSADADFTMFPQWIQWAMTN